MYLFIESNSRSTLLHAATVLKVCVFRVLDGGLVVPDESFSPSDLKSMQTDFSKDCNCIKCQLPRPED